MAKRGRPRGRFFRLGLPNPTPAPQTRQPGPLPRHFDARCSKPSPAGPRRPSSFPSVPLGRGGMLSESPRGPHGRPGAGCPRVAPYLVRGTSSPDSSWPGALTCVVSLKLGGRIHGHLTCGAVETPLLAPAFPTHTASHSNCCRFRLWGLWPRFWGAGWARRRGGRGGSIEEV